MLGAISLGEFDLIARYFKLKRPVRRSSLGVGDDCALLAPAPGMQLAVSSDMLVEDRHAVQAAVAISASSKIATARVQPAEAPRILCGKQLMKKPSPGSASRLCSFSRWQ